MTSREPEIQTRETNALRIQYGETAGDAIQQQSLITRYAVRHVRSVILAIAWLFVNKMFYDRVCLKDPDV